jgi:hypothetical protein
VSPKLLEVYAEDGMSLDQLMAFTVNPDHARQEQVLCRYRHNELKRIKSFCIAKPMQKLRWAERRLRRGGYGNFRRGRDGRSSTPGSRRGAGGDGEHG